MEVIYVGLVLEAGRPILLTANVPVSLSLSYKTSSEVLICGPPHLTAKLESTGHHPERVSNFSDINFIKGRIKLSAVMNYFMQLTNMSLF